MKATVRVAHVVIEGRKVYQIERVVFRRGNRALAMNWRAPDIREADRCRLLKAMAALRKGAA
jgi:hypothetical protein